MPEAQTIRDSKATGESPYVWHIYVEGDPDVWRRWCDGVKVVGEHQIPPSNAPEPCVICREYPPYRFSR